MRRIVANGTAWVRQSVSAGEDFITGIDSLDRGDVWSTEDAKGWVRGRGELGGGAGAPGPEAPGGHYLGFGLRTECCELAGRRVAGVQGVLVAV